MNNPNEGNFRQRSTPALRTKTWDFLAILANLAGIAGIIGGILSLAINGLIFWAWGLNFYQIATPSDILMSGVLVAIWLGSLIVGLVVVALIPATLASLFDMSAKPIRPIILHKISRIFQVSGQGIFEVTYVVLAMFAALTVWFMVSLFEEKSFTILGILAIQSFMMVYLLTAIIQIEIGWYEESAAYVRRRIIAISIMLSIICIESSYYIAVTRSPTLFFAALPEHGCSGTHIGAVWIGSESVVARCGDDGSLIKATDRFIVLSRSDLVLQNKRFN